MDTTHHSPCTSVGMTRIDKECAIVGYRQLRHPALAGDGGGASIASGKERQTDREVPGIFHGANRSWPSGRMDVCHERIEHHAIAQRHIGHSASNVVAEAAAAGQAVALG